MPAGHDDLVAEFSRNPKAAAFQPAVHHHGTADPRAQGDADEPALPLPGAEAPFRPRGGIGVVGQQDRAAQQSLEVVPQRFIAPGEVRAEQHRPAVEVHPPGRADSHRPDAVATAQLLHEFHNHLFHRAGVVPGRGAPGLAEDAAVGVHDAGGDLGASDVHTDRQPFAPEPEVLPEALAGGQRILPGRLPAPPCGRPSIGSGLVAGRRCVHGSPFYCRPYFR
ncbi:hypothetical protein D9M72_484530 [compost metagenome]